MQHEGFRSQGPGQSFRDSAQPQCYLQTNELTRMRAHDVRSPLLCLEALLWIRNDTKRYDV